ncbi:uncharacterized protein LOC119744498 [Patiria miniata]|uniref:Uncharacterized protein n=1 Tax=Patiria miniata TaxID=46514 RepID=A0A914BJB2_PATMI|nr:uncharacterized protein LOC119744498 [Patiria miniata]
MKFACQDDRCYYTSDELPFDGFVKTGKLAVWQLLKLLEGSRHQRGKHGPEAKYNEQYLLFVRSQTIEIFPAFYSKLSANRPVRIVSSCSYIGKTSYCIDEELFDLLTNELLERSSYHAVVVSKETRRPIAIPRETSQAVIQPRDGKRPLPDPTFPRRPSQHFTHRRAVMASDTDANKHFNQAGYLLFSLDCISLAAIAGSLSAFKTDISFYNAKKVWVRYLNEAIVGEEVTISCWEDEECRHTIWVELTKGSKVIGQCQLQFYEDSTNKDIESLPQAKL